MMMIQYIDVVTGGHDADFVQLSTSHNGGGHPFVFDIIRHSHSMKSNHLNESKNVSLKNLKI